MPLTIAQNKANGCEEHKQTPLYEKGFDFCGSEVYVLKESAVAKMGWWLVEQFDELKDEMAG